MKKYKISTIEDISNVINEDNFSNFMIDFTDVMIKLVKVKELIKYNTGEYPISIIKDFTWKNDDIRGVNKIKIKTNKK